MYDNLNEITNIMKTIEIANTPNTALEYFGVENNGIYELSLYDLDDTKHLFVFSRTKVTYNSSIFELDTHRAINGIIDVARVFSKLVNEDAYYVIMDRLSTIYNRNY